MTAIKPVFILLLSALIIGCEPGDEPPAAIDNSETTEAAEPSDDALSTDEVTSDDESIEASTTDEAESSESDSSATDEPESSNEQASSDEQAAEGDKPDDTVVADVVEEQPAEPEPLMIGSPAPELDIEHWIQDGQGQFAKVAEFESGKVYVVEFWATWCGPCIASMPHIAELQKQYADRGVQVVSITREDPETVEKFLAREVRGAEEGDEVQTYDDLTSVYCLTADPDNSTSRDYMVAAKQRGIPCAFIVGKDAKIEWIGHPMRMDEPLEQIVSDQWDRSAFAAKFAAEQKIEEMRMKVMMAARGGNVDDALKMIDGALRDPDFASAKSGLISLKFQMLAGNKERADEAAAVAIEMLSDESLDAGGVNNLAWNLYGLARSNRFRNEEVIQAAIDASERVVDNAGAQEPYLRDTIAHLYHELGDLETALEQQQVAFDAADESMKPRLAPFLNQLKKELEQANAPEEEAKEGASKEDGSGEASSDQSDSEESDSGDAEE